MQDYTALSDSDLVLLLKQADHAAFTEVYRRYSDILFAKVHKMLRDEDASKDVIQELFIHLWGNPGLLKADGNLSGYLYVAARSRVLQLIRKDQYRNDFVASLSQFMEEASLDTLQQLDERELTLVLQQEIEKLPAKMRAVFKLSREQDLSYAEIARQLGISEETVRKQVHNSIKALRESLPSNWTISMLIILLLE